MILQLLMPGHAGGGWHIQMMPSALSAVIDSRSAVRLLPEKRGPDVVAVCGWQWSLGVIGELFWNSTEIVLLDFVSIILFHYAASTFLVCMCLRICSICQCDRISKRGIAFSTKTSCA